MIEEKLLKIYSEITNLNITDNFKKVESLIEQLDFVKKSLILQNTISDNTYNYSFYVEIKYQENILGYIYIKLSRGYNQKNTRHHIENISKILSVKIFAEQAEYYKNLNEKYKKILDSVCALIHVTSLEEYKVLYANKKIKNEFKRELVGKTCWEVFRNEIAPCSHCSNNLIENLSEEIDKEFYWDSYNPVLKKWFANYDKIILWMDDKPALLQIATDIGRLKETENKLKTLQKRYKNVLEKISLIAIMLNNKGKILFANDFFCELTEYNRNELIGKNWFDIFIPDNLKENLRSYFNLHIAQGKLPNNFTHQIATKRGQIRTVLWNNIPFEKDGKIIKKYTSIGQDITDVLEYQRKLKRNALEKDILLKEVNHRVKNNLNVISNLLYLQKISSNDINVKNILESSINRIKTLSLIHNQLYSTENFVEIDMKTYFENMSKDLLYIFDKKKDITIEVLFDKVYMPLNAATATAIVFNELVTNSLKYAFDKNQKGRIGIHLEKSDNSYKLIYFDNGKGLPNDFSISEHDSLGLKLVKMITEQFNGKILIESKKGFKITINFTL